MAACAEHSNFAPGDLYNFCRDRSGTVFGNNSAAMLKPIHLTPPEERSAVEAGHPKKESEKVAHRIKPAEGTGSPIAGNAPACHQRLDDSIENAPGEQRYAQVGHTERATRDQGQQTIRCGESQPAAHVTFWP